MVFVFFPLQHFPESQLGLLNTVHDHVLNTIRNIAKFLPNGLTLVVKDHPWSYGKRSESFLNKIKNTLNVKLIAPTTSNNLVYEKMDYLISLSGTVIFEAALINKPAIILGDLEMMLDLPNIFKLQNLNEIGELIKKIDSEFKDYSSTEDCKKKILNYISAALDIGYDNEKYNDDFRHNKESLEYMWKFYLKEINKIYKYKNKFIFN